MKSLAQVFSEVLGISCAAVQETLQFNAIPEWDSLNHVNLMMALEEAYAVHIDEERMVELTNVKAIRDFVEQEVGSRH
jgi:citrate synthase